MAAQLNYARLPGPGDFLPPDELPRVVTTEDVDSFYSLACSYMAMGYDTVSAKRMARLCMEASA